MLLLIWLLLLLLLTIIFIIRFSACEVRSLSKYIPDIIVARDFCQSYCVFLVAWKISQSALQLFRGIWLPIYLDSKRYGWTSKSKHPPSPPPKKKIVTNFTHPSRFFTQVIRNPPSQISAGLPSERPLFQTQAGPVLGVLQ